MTLGQRIQELRRQKSWSQENLGERLGVSRQAISRWEMDGAVPEVDKLMAMARLFGVSLDQLLQGEEPQEQTQKTESKPGNDHKMVRLLAITCALLTLVSVLSLVTTLYFRHQVMAIIDPPAPPDRPVTAVEYAIVPDYDTRTYDLVLEMAAEDKKALKGWDVTLRITTMYKPGGKYGGLEPWEYEQEIRFKNGKASLHLEDLPFYFQRSVGMVLTYVKEEGRDTLEGLQPILSIKPTTIDKDWELWEDKEFYGQIPVENPGLLEG